MAGSTRRGKGKSSARDEERAAAASSQPDLTSVQPLKPRPRLLAALSIVFALWLGFLVVLYFTTARPRRSTAPQDTSVVADPGAPPP